MQLSNTKVLFAALAITAFFSGHVLAQSGSIAPTPSMATPTSTSAFGTSGINSGISGSPTVSQPAFSGATTTSPMVSSPMPTSTTAYGGNTYGNATYGNATYGNATYGNSYYGPATINNTTSNGQCCNHRQIQPSQGCVQPVQSCCGQLGRLGIPSLTTPPNSYRPPVGRNVGRPLFGRWNGF